MLRPVLLLLLFTPLLSAAQKPDRRVIKALQADVSYLASDALQGRMTGSEGERKAADYLVARYERLKIPAWGGAYRHPFQFAHGIEMNDSRITLGGQSNLLGGEAFPLPFSGNGSVSGEVLIEVQEQGAIWILPLYEHAADATNPAFDWQQSAWKQARQAISDGATGIVFYENFPAASSLTFDPLCSLAKLKVPVALVGQQQWKELSANNANVVSVSLDIRLSTPERSADNIIAWVDNRAPKTIVIGANYDSPAPNDNASGTAAVLQLAEWLKKNRLRNYNVILAHFSGGRIGQLGAKAFCKEAGAGPEKLAGMIDLYRLGQLSDSLLQFSPGAAFNSKAWFMLWKAGFREAQFTERQGGSEYSVFAGHGIPAISISGTKASDNTAQIDYSAESRAITGLQAALKMIDATTDTR